MTAIARWIPRLLRPEDKPSKAFVYGLKLMRSLILKVHDPTVRYELFGSTISLPLSHDLPFILALHLGYGKNLADLAEVIARKYADPTIVDIGANIGDSAIIMRSVAKHARIICIEGDPEYAKLLRQNTAELDNIEVVSAFAASDSQCRVVRHGGSAHLEPGNDGIKTVDLGNLLAEESVHLLKVDTDGMDGRILRAAADLLHRDHPVVFFEYDPYFLEKFRDDGLSLFPFLSEIGYSDALVYDNLGNYMIRLSVGDQEHWEDIHAAFSGNRGSRYCDIAVFHRRDRELVAELRGAVLDRAGMRQRQAMGALVQAK